MCLFFSPLLTLSHLYATSPVGLAPVVVDTIGTASHDRRTSGAHRARVEGGGGTRLHVVTRLHVRAFVYIIIFGWRMYTIVKNVQNRVVPIDKPQDRTCYGEILMGYATGEHRGYQNVGYNRSL